MRSPRIWFYESWGPDMSSDLFRSEALQHLRPRPWQPPLLSKPASGLAVASLVSVSAALLIGFASLFNFAQKERVTGFLEPSDGWTTVRAARFAVVRDCLVSEGDMVATGDILCEFSSSQGLAEGQPLESKLLIDLGERRAALSARSEAVNLKYDEELKLLAQSRLVRLEEAAHLGSEVNALSKRREIAARQRDQGRELSNSGVLSEIGLNELEDRYQTRAAELARASRQLELVESEIRAHEVRVRRVDSARREELAAMEELRQALDMDEARLRVSGEERVLAPRPGQVVTIQAKPGASVSPGDALLDILPVDGALVASLYADPAVMSDIDVGQVVRVYIDALPYERHGAQAGVVESISKTTIATKWAGPAAAYRIKVLFPRGSTCHGNRFGRYVRA